MRIKLSKADNGTNPNYDPKNDPDYDPNYVLVEHGGVEIEWDVGEYVKRIEIVGPTIFDAINQYWASRSTLQQETIWQCYQQIKNVLESVSDAIPLLHELQPLMQALYDEHKIEEIDRWFAFNSLTHNINIPAQFEEEYVYSDERPGNREKTYTRQDYVRLVGLAIALRPMIPIWGEFLNLTKRETGTNYKEKYAYALLAKTKLVDCTAMEKLRIYLAGNLKSDRPMEAAILAGVGSEDYVSWLLSALVVNRICVGDVRGIEGPPHLVIASYKYIEPYIRSVNGVGFGDQVKAKEFGTGDGDQEASRLESFKIRSEHAQGDISIYDVYLRDENLVTAAQRLYPAIDLEILQEVWESCGALKTTYPQSFQIALMQWILAPIIPPRAGFYIEPDKALNGLALAQTLLFQKGHLRLGQLITAKSSQGAGVQQVSGLGSMARLTREQIDELNKLYPYGRIPMSRPNAKSPNDAIVAIDKIADGFSTGDWTIIAPDRFVTLNGVTIPRRQGCPPDIKQMLAALVIDVAKRTLYS